MPIFLKPIILYVVAVILIRLSGRRSISQMTISQTVLIISIGDIIVEPFVEKDISKTVYIAIIFTILLILFESIEFKSKVMKKLMVGEEIVLVEKGIINMKNMKKVKLSDSELYSRLRQQGIQNVSDLELATMEPSGKLGYQLKKEVQPITVDEMQFVLNKILQACDKDEKIDLIKEFTKK